MRPHQQHWIHIVRVRRFVVFVYAVLSINHNCRLGWSGPRIYATYATASLCVDSPVFICARICP